MARRLETLPTEANINLPSGLFNKVYLPYLHKIYNYEVYYGGAASGKCFAKGTKVVMYSGETKPVEDVVVGDLLMGPDSKPRKVLELSRGIGQLYKVRQCKGIDYVVNEQHILCLKKSIACKGKPNQKRRYPNYDQYVEISVKDYLEKTNRWKKNFNGYRSCVDFESKPVELDPYYLGVWLGDGSSANTHVTTEDQEVVEFLQNYADKLRTSLSVVAIRGKAKTYSFLSVVHPQYIRDICANMVAQLGWKVARNIKNSCSRVCRETGFSLKNISFWIKQKEFIEKIEWYKHNPQPIDYHSIREYVKSLSLLQKMDKYNIRNNKHIPDEYLYNSREVRLQVLAGLIDTDGHSTRNCYDIVQKNKLLAYQIKYLCNSLGLRCSLYETQKKCTNNGAIGTYYRSTISGDLTQIPVKIERKKIKTCGIQDPLITNISVAKDSYGDYYGFEVDGDHKFLLEDFTVTHNSTFIGQKLAVQMTIMPGRNLVCLRKQKKDCVKSCWGEIYNSLVKFKLKRFWEIRDSPNEHIMKNRVNGNVILFEGLDDVEDIKSIKFTNETATDDDPTSGGDSNITDIWYEEVNQEKSEKTIEQLDIRLRDPYLKNRLILSFNPVSRAHFLYNLINVNYKMQGVDALILKTTYKDNAWCPEETRKKYERYKYTDPYMYQVYTLGNWGTMGQTVFNANKVQDRLNQLAKIHADNPPKKGDFYYSKTKDGVPVKDSYRWQEHVEGLTTIYTMPEKMHPYVLAFDTAGEGSDYYAGHVIDNISGEQVAVFHSKGNPDVCVWQLYGLAVMYNNALVCPESNFNDWPIKAFLLMGYRNLYRRVSAGDKTHIRREDRYGFRTGVDTRPTMISDMIFWTEEHMHLINDERTLNEMLVFTRQEKKIKGIFMGAEAGENDDLVMSFAIVLQARAQQFYEMVPDKQKIEGDGWEIEELEFAVAEGRIDRQAAAEYIAEHDLKTKRLAGCITPKGRSRYGRS